MAVTWQVATQNTALTTNAQQTLIQQDDLSTALTARSLEPLQPFISFLSTSYWPADAHSSLVATGKYSLPPTGLSCFNPRLSPQSQNLLPVLPGNPSMVHSLRSNAWLTNPSAQPVYSVVVSCCFYFPNPTQLHRNTQTHVRTSMRRLCLLNICSRAAKQFTSLWVDDPRQWREEGRKERQRPHQGQTQIKICHRSRRKPTPRTRGALDGQILRWQKVPQTWYGQTTFQKNYNMTQ